MDGVWQTLRYVRRWMPDDIAMANTKALRHTSIRGPGLYGAW